MFLNHEVALTAFEDSSWSVDVHRCGLRPFFARRTLWASSVLSLTNSYLSNVAWASTNYSLFWCLVLPAPSSKVHHNIKASFLHKDSVQIAFWEYIQNTRQKSSELGITCFSNQVWTLSRYYILKKQAKPNGSQKITIVPTPGIQNFAV